MQDRKYFRLTTTQIGILAGLAGAACLLFGLTGWFLFRGGFSRTPANTPIPLSTSTPFIIPTITPTPTSIPVPYEQLIPAGWVQHRTELVELWLPPAFTTGDATLFGQTANVAILELALSGKTSESSLYQMLVTVSYEPLVGDSLDSFLTNEIAKLPVEARLTERREVSINSTNARRLVFEIRSNNIDINALSYAFLDGGTVWYVEYAAQINEFYEMLPTFEQSVKTFRIVR
ncbi:MAG TPA: hypothetical protein VJM08_07010 [Anaerolineales bacterium]|nr:hypothetical protein [Anaerolineales bacterium]